MRGRVEEEEEEEEKSNRLESKALRNPSYSVDTPPAHATLFRPKWI